MSVKRIEGYRNFCNKLWNAARYAMLQLDGKGAEATGERPQATALINRWILSRLDVALAAANQGVHEYRLDDATLGLYHFVWNELCDWYLELTKPLLAGGDPGGTTRERDEAEALAKETRATLVHVLESVLRALHPMMPFITEEIWQNVPKRAGHAKACAVAAYPQAGKEGLRDEAAEKELTWLSSVISAARAIRAEHDLAPKKHLSLTVRTGEAEKRALLSSQKGAIETLCNATLTLEDASDVIPEHTATAVAEGITVLVPLTGLVDMAKEKERVTRELSKVEKDLMVLAKKLGNADFIARAPAEVIAKDTARKAELEAAKQKLGDALKQMA
ncbi:MAG: class I tRNA ligase family protein [Myxococcales bacterium]